MDNYIETAVPRRNNFTDTVISFMACVPFMLIAVYIFILVSAVSNSIFMVLGVLLSLILFYISYKIFLKFNIEWEYTLVGNEIRFSKIINKNKRRDLLTVSLSKAEIVARVNDNANNYRFKNFSGKKFSFISQTTNDYFYMITFTEKGQQVCICFEPSDKMKENFKTTLRGKFFE